MTKWPSRSVHAVWSCTIEHQAPRAPSPTVMEAAAHHRLRETCTKWNFPPGTTPVGLCSIFWTMISPTLEQQNVITSCISMSELIMAIKVALLGYVSVGKSTVLNALLHDKPWLALFSYLPTADTLWRILVGRRSSLTICNWNLVHGSLRLVLLLRNLDLVIKKPLNKESKSVPSIIAFTRFFMEEIVGVNFSVQRSMPVLFRSIFLNVWMIPNMGDTWVGSFVSTFAIKKILVEP